jgi:hypothetical protein
MKFVFDSFASDLGGDNMDLGRGAKLFNFYLIQILRSGIADFAPPSISATLSAVTHINY